MSIIFQAISWDTRHENANIDKTDPLWKEKLSFNKEGRYTIRAFGRDKQGNAINILIPDFCPDFYVSLGTTNWEKIKKFGAQAQIWLSNPGKEWKRTKYEKAIENLDLDFRIRHDYYTERKKIPMVQIFMNNYNALRDLRDKIRDRGVDWLGSFAKYECFDGGIDPLLRFFHRTGTNPCGWLEIQNIREETSDFRGEKLLEVSWKDIRVPENPPQTNAPFIICSFDIETVPENDNNFPSAFRPDDLVVQIGLSFRTLGSEKSYLKVVLILGEAEESSEYEAISCRDEETLLLSFSGLLKQENPDIITGYNILGFDWNYLYTRALHLGIEEEFMDIGKIGNPGGGRLKGEHKIKELQSSALHINHFDYIEIPGREQMDVMFAIRKSQEKLRSYSLNYVSEHYLGRNKVDLPYRQLFKYFREGGKDKNKIIADYCIQDVELCQELIFNRDLLNSDIGMSRVSLVPFNYLQFRGQGIKILSCLAQRLYLANFSILDERRKEIKDIKYSGGHVIEPRELGLIQNKRPEDSEFLSLDKITQERVYQKLLAITGIVSVLDYMSLYPTQIMAHNISPDTRLIAPDPNIEYEEFHIQDKEDESKIIMVSRFVKYNPEKPETRGIFPEIMEYLFGSRKKYKKLMEEAEIKADLEKDPEKKLEWKRMANIYDLEQKAYKVTMNAVYGYTGSKFSILYFLDVASTVTHLGREKLKYAADWMTQKHPESPVIYGDSIPGFMPVSIRTAKTGPISIPIQDLWPAVSRVTQEGKEYIALPPGFLEAHSGDSWTPIRRIIRHLTNKKIFRVWTQEGSWVEITEDHSLLGYGRRPLKPENLLGQKIMLINNKMAEVVSVSLVRKNLEFVYDLETESGVYQAGFGNILVKNTDSIFVKINIRSLVRDWLEFLNCSLTELKKRWEEKCERWAEEITRDINLPPTRLEYEKTLIKLIQMKKKNYASLTYTPGLEAPKKTIRGIASLRREYAPIIGKMIGKYSDIFYNQDIDGDKNFVEKIREALQEDLINLFSGNVPLEDLEMTSSIKDKYKFGSNRMAMFVSRMFEADPGTAPQPGDRVSFYYAKISLPEIEARRARDGLDTRPAPKRSGYKRRVRIFDGDRLVPKKDIIEGLAEIDYEYYAEHHIRKSIKEFVSYIDSSLAKEYDNIILNWKTGKIKSQRRVTLDMFFGKINRG